MKKSKEISFEEINDRPIPDPSDVPHMTTTLAEVSKCGNGYELKLADGWMFMISDPGFVPEAGDEVKLYGKGFGYPVRGMVIRGMTAYYRTEKEYEADRKREAEESDARSRAEYEEALEDNDRRISSLPEPFRDRIAGFRERNPHDWHKYEAYELFVCEQAVVIADAVGSAEDLRSFYELPFERQRERVPAIDDGHSGNTFGMACRLAHAYLSTPEIIPRIHGAMCPLVGCERYGCHATTVKQS